MNQTERIANGLLSIKAVFLNPYKPFVWASGIKAPMYCDNRLTLSDVNLRNEVEQALADTIREVHPDCEMIMGTATAGIAHGAIVAHLIGVPMGYVRRNSKDHGRNKQIEGKFRKGQKIVVIEDLISTAGSCVDVADCLREAGADVLGIVSIFSYDMKKGSERLQNAKVSNTSLTNLDLLLDVAVKEGYINKAVVPAIKSFRDNPYDERWMKMMQEIYNENFTKLKNLIVAKNLSALMKPLDLCAAFSSGSELRLLGDVFAEFIVYHIEKDIDAIVGLSEESQVLATTTVMSMAKNCIKDIVMDNGCNTPTDRISVVVDFLIDEKEKSVIENIEKLPDYVVSLFKSEVVISNDKITRLSIFQ
jgi:orotate phosphoribosyltransferase